MIMLVINGEYKVSMTKTKTIEETIKKSFLKVFTIIFAIVMPSIVLFYVLDETWENFSKYFLASRDSGNLGTVYFYK